MMKKYILKAKEFFFKAKSYVVKHYKIFVPVAVVLVILLVILISRGAGKSSNSQFQTIKIENGDLTATVGATGTVRANQTALLTWQTAGTVEQVKVRVGDTVQAGDVLASLQKTSLPQNVILADADLVSAQRDLDNLLKSETAMEKAHLALFDAQDAYDNAKEYRNSLNGKITRYRIKVIIVYTVRGTRRVPKLYSRRVDPDQETIDKGDAKLALATAQLEDAQREWDRLKNGPDPDDVAAAQARVDANQATINMGRLIAPFAGSVTEAHPMPGDQVSVGTPGFRIDNLSRQLVDVQVSEVDINSIQAGQPVTLTFDAILGQEYHGKVTEVGQVGNTVEGVVNFIVTVELTDADEMVKPGMTVAVNIVFKQLQDVLLVPNRAVRLMDGKRVVYVLQNGRPVEVEIRLGASSDTMSVVADGDLKEGDLIILNPPATFQTNQHPTFIQR